MQPFEPFNRNALKGNPVSELIALNMRMFKDVSIKPNEWSNLKDPQEMFDKSMKTFVRNGHAMLEYFQEATEILERNWARNSERTLKDFQQGMSQSKNAMSRTVSSAKRSTSGSKRTSTRRKTH